MLRKPVMAALVAAAFLVGVVAPAGASSSIDVRVNDPDVAGDASSDATARFPTNKQNEPSVAVNPTDSRLLIAGSNDEQRQPRCGPGPVRGPNADANDCSFFPNVGTSGVYTSSDGGAHWRNRGLLDDQASWRSLPIGRRLVSDGDPVIVYGPKPDGRGGYGYANGARAYYATLASYADNAGTYPAAKAPGYVAVSTSDDNGTTWSAAVLVTTKDNPNDFNDKESIWVDNLASSPWFGRVYVSWTEFRSASSGSEPVMVSVSADAGRSFTPPKQLSPAGNNGTGNGRQGSAVRSGPDGTVYVAWEQATSQVLSTSSDGGKKWTRPSPIGPVTDLPFRLPGANFRTDSFPTIAADPRRGSTTVHASWANDTAVGSRVVVATSTDRVTPSTRGSTWRRMAASMSPTRPSGR
jgi:hypothetical protein